MKVLQIIGGGEKGGSRKHIITLCKELIKRSVDVELICFLDDTVAASARKEGIPITVLTMKNILSLNVILRLSQYIKYSKPDLVHTHGVRANFIGRMAVKRLGIPVITTVHSSICSDYSCLPKRHLYHRIENLTRRYTDLFIVVSGSLAEELKKKGVSPKKIEIVYNGLELTREKEDSSEKLREQIAVDMKKPIIMSVGRLEEVKNHAMLLEVFATLKQRGLAFHGVLVGDGPLLTDLKRMADRLNISDSLSFLGFRSEAAALLREADVFVLTSKMEGLPITLLEAMAAQTPVVVTSVGGMSEVVNVAQNGFVASLNDIHEFANKVEELLTDKATRERLGENGHKALMKYFSVERFVTNTLEIYNRFLSKSGAF